MTHELVLHTKHPHGEGICKAHGAETPFTVFDVDTEKSKWFGQPIKELGAYGRRKFENWVILTTNERIKVIYH